MNRQDLFNALNNVVAALIAVLVLVVLAVDVYAIYVDAMEFLEAYHAILSGKRDNNSLI